MSGPEILTKRLRLSRLIATDAPALFEYRSDPEVCRYQSFEPGSLAEAVSGLLGYLLGDCGKHRVFASVDPRNEPSVKLLRRVGMRKEAHFLKNVWFKGEWVDDMIFGILKSDWLNR